MGKINQNVLGKYIINRINAVVTKVFYLMISSTVVVLIKTKESYSYGFLFRN